MFTKEGLPLDPSLAATITTDASSNCGPARRITCVPTSSSLRPAPLVSSPSSVGSTRNSVVVSNTFNKPSKRKSRASSLQLDYNDEVTPSEEAVEARDFDLASLASLTMLKHMRKTAVKLSNELIAIDKSAVQDTRQDEQTSHAPQPKSHHYCSRSSSLVLG